MESSLNTRQTDPHDVNPGPSTQDRELVSRADERLVHAYAQIARADEQLARVNEQLSKLEYDARPKKSANRFRRPYRCFLRLIIFVPRAVGAGGRNCSGRLRDHTSARYLCTKLIDMEPSPTAEATRFMAPERTSPAAKIPGQLVSSR